MPPLLAKTSHGAKRRGTWFRADVTIALRINNSYRLLAAALVFFAIGSLYFHYEVRWKTPACSFDLLESSVGRCDLGMSDSADVRIVAATGPIRDRKTIPVSIDLRSLDGQTRRVTLRPKSLSVGAYGPGLVGNRYYSTSNYGVLTVSPGETIEVSVRDSGTLKLLRVDVHDDPMEWPVWVAYVGCFFSLLLAVRYRESIFLNKLTRWIPYSLVLLLGALLFSWNL